MIHLGLTDQQKVDRITAYCSAHGVRRTVVLTPDELRFGGLEVDHEVVEWAEIIEYKFFYRLLQEIDQRTLLVVNECLRTQSRSDLTYNCMRHFLAQAGHQLVFQFLPIIDGPEDHMILFDFDTKSQWKRQPFSAELLANATYEVVPVVPTFNEVMVKASPKLRKAYEAEKKKLFDGLGVKDPHTIPRNLYLTTGKEKLGAIKASQSLVGRNNRFKLDRMVGYREKSYDAQPYTVFEFCHNHIEFNDFMCLSRQTEFDVLTTDMKVDQWYLQRYRNWANELQRVYATLQRVQDGAPGSD